MSQSVPGATPLGEPTPEERAATTPLGELLSDVSRDLSSLFRQEVALAKAELTDSAKKADSAKKGGKVAKKAEPTKKAEAAKKGSTAKKKKDGKKSKSGR